MKRPSFQFYPADWQGNSNLRRCSHEEKGIWTDVMCLLHDQEEYGVLRWPLKEIAQAVGTTLPKLKGLTTKGVLKGADAGETCVPYIYTPRSGRKDGEPVTLVPEQQGPIWYSSRMVRDEYVRTIRGESSRFGAAKDDASKPAPKIPPKDAPKPPFGDGSTSSSSSSPTGIIQEVDKSPSCAAPKVSRLPFAELPDEWRAWAATNLGWSPDIIADVWAMFRDHWLTKTGKTALKSDWFATWRNWCRNERPKGGNHAAHQPGHRAPTKDERSRAAAARAAEAIGIVDSPGHGGT